MPSAVDFLCYTALVGFIAYEIKEESRNIFSSKDKDHPDSIAFGDGCGKFVHWNKYINGDSFKDIINKTKTLNEGQIELPVWRRSAMVAFITTIVISVTVHRELLSFPRFFLYFLIIFFLFYYSFNYYAYHYVKPLCDVQNKNLEQLENKYSLLRKNILKNLVKRKNEKSCDKIPIKDTKNYTSSMV